MRQKRLFIVGSALLLISIMLVVYGQSTAVDGDSDDETPRVDWGHKAYEIVTQDQEFKKIAGDNPREITGIIHEPDYAYMYYQVDDKIYNVSVDFKTDSVKSIAEENDEKRIAWLNSVNATLHRVTLVPINCDRVPY
ncbi:hypothetical protein [Methanocella conradii]|uniref:hypothetical protein n=1 Tax=Methanocella conradii TaxID=1175444 RepID=UPI0024B33DFC|nr:hypothetical protein [Methanocella conradii]MDI6898025.1 hypothetical protein [Methanocella conradii]